MKTWTTAETEYLRAHYPTTCTEVLMKECNATRSSVHSKAHYEGLKKDTAFLSKNVSIRQNLAVKNGTYKGFHKGTIPANKGKKMDAAMRKRMAHTWFRKGNRPPNALPIWSQRRRSDGYLEIKVSEPSTWQMLHRRIWEETHGKIPDKHVIVFRNKNKDDLRIENLEIIDQVTVMARNTIQRFPPELQKTIKLISNFKKTIKEYEQ